MMLNFPRFIDEVAFASLPFDNPQIWTDLSARTRVRSWARGRQQENADPDTGTSSTTFENIDRALDPQNAASVYAPNVLPMRRSRCRATLDNITFFNLFTNFIDPMLGWQLDNSRTGYSEATAAANDGFDVLATYELAATDAYPQQHAGLRIDALLTTAAWPAAERDIDTTSAQSDVQAAIAGSLTGTSALDAIKAAAANDNGLFYIDARGYATFKGRHRTDTRYTVSQATFCDKANYSAGRFLYATAPPTSSKIINDYRVTRAGGTLQPWSDPTSIGKYRDRAASVSTLHATDGEALSYAQYRVAIDKDPMRRYDEVTFIPGADSAMWLMLLSLELGDRVTIMQSPVGGGAADVRDMHVEAINASVGPAATSTWKLRLSPAPTQLGWALGDAVNGLLGQTTYVTY